MEWTKAADDVWIPTTVGLFCNQSVTTECVGGTEKFASLYQTTYKAEALCRKKDPMYEVAISGKRNCQGMGNKYLYCLTNFLNISTIGVLFFKLYCSSNCFQGCRKSNVYAIFDKPTNLISTVSICPQ